MGTQGESATAAKETNGGVTKATTTQPQQPQSAADRRARRKLILTQKRALRYKGKDGKIVWASSTKVAAAAATTTAAVAEALARTTKLKGPVKSEAPSAAPSSKAPTAAASTTTSSSQPTPVVVAAMPPLATKAETTGVENTVFTINPTQATVIPIEPEPTIVLTPEPTWHKSLSSARTSGQASASTATQPKSADLALSDTQSKKVDAVFEKLFGYSWGTKFAMNDDDSDDSDGDAHMEDRDKSDLRRTRQVLCRILGRSPTARILRIQPTNTTDKSRVIKTRPMYVNQLLKRNLPPLKTSMPIWKSATHPTKPTRPGTTVTPTPASQQTAAVSTGQPAGVAIKNTALPSKIPPAAQATGGGGGVDDLLKKMNETGKVTTIAKTAHDWENFKTDTGLAASLEEHTESKGAFLKKKDFLDRVDYRKFEHERQERERDRAKRK